MFKPEDFKSFDIYGDGDFLSFAYESIIERIGHVITYQSFGSYHGDSIYLLHKDGQWGYLCFGWGSCSVCDAAEACRTLEDIAELANRLSASVQWFPSQDALLHFLNVHDWEGDYLYGISEDLAEIETLKQELVDYVPRTPARNC